MKSWCTYPIVKPKNVLTWCIFSFQWNLGSYILGYVHMNSTYLYHLLLLLFLVVDTHDLQLVIGDMY